MKLRVWHIPQVPMEPFYIEVSNVEEGVKFMDALAAYDCFQFENKIKPDYCNANGLQMWDEGLTEDELVEMELEDRWVDWCNEHFDDPREYLNSLS
ncbi:superinfection exclusion protein [Salmonella enterica subsp. houtenae]|nr:superinfection exclusion protein [Salmonella enterica subsp. enterica serovar Anatum]EDQ3388063.1 superinfection exclusion protein [Salmonella enterica subsp. houtenae]